MTESLLPFLPGDNFASIGLLDILLRCFSTQIESFLERGGGGAKQQSTQQQGTQVFFLPLCSRIDWIECVAGDQADVNLSRGPVCRLAQPQRGAQLSSPPLRACHEALGHRHVPQQPIWK